MGAIDVTSEHIVKVREYFGVTEQDIKRDLKTIKEWIQERPDLPTIDDDSFLERCLLRNKFRVDQTKQKLEGYFTVRRQYVSLCSDNYKRFKPSEQLTYSLPLPKLTPSGERVIFWRLKRPNAKDYDLTEIVKFNLLLFEVMIRNDYAVGDRFLADFTGQSFSSICGNNPLLIARFLSLYRSAYSGRVAAFDFINAPYVVNVLLSVLKQLLPTKLYKKIQVHKDLDSLHKTIPRECLPKEYGGDLDTLENLIGKWDKVFEHHHPIFEQNLKHILRETD